MAHPRGDLLIGWFKSITKLAITKKEKRKKNILNLSNEEKIQLELPMQVEFEILLKKVCREGGGGKKKIYLTNLSLFQCQDSDPKHQGKHFFLWNLLEALRKSPMRADLAIFLQQRKFEYGD